MSTVSAAILFGPLLKCQVTKCVASPVCIRLFRDSDIKHGLINDLLNTGTDLELEAEIENWIIDADGVQSPEQIWDQIPIFIGPC